MPNVGIYIDEASGIKRVMGNKKLYRRMLGLFLTSAEFASLEDGLKAEDYTKAGDAAHAIKGITGNLSLPLLFDLSSELMQQLRQGPPARDTIAAYREALAKTIAEVEAVTARLNQELA